MSLHTIDTQRKMLMISSRAGGWIEQEMAAICAEETSMNHLGAVSRKCNVLTMAFSPAMLGWVGASLLATAMGRFKWERIMRETYSSDRVDTLGDTERII